MRTLVPHICGIFQCAELNSAFNYLHLWDYWDYCIIIIIISREEVELRLKLKTTDTNRSLDLQR